VSGLSEAEEMAVSDGRDDDKWKAEKRKEKN
jgi:hypothetical protein